MKLAKVLIFLSACALLVGCNKAANTSNGSSATSKTSSTTTNTTTTTATAPKSSAEATQAPKASAASGGKATKPEDAAEGLFNAWKSKDRTAAANFATGEAITSLFSEGGPEGLEFQGCDQQGDGYLCGYSYEGGGLMMLVEGSDSDGYKVTSATFVAD